MDNEAQAQAGQHLAHEAPLAWLATQLHEGRSLAERVRVLRKKRRKQRAAATLAEEAQP